MQDLTLFEEWVGVGVIVGGEHEEGRELKLWLFCKMKKNIKLKEKETQLSY